MADQELIIKISGNVEDYSAALELAGQDTEKLGDSLKKITEVAAVAWAALSVEIYESVKAYNEHQTALLEVNNSLQNQGIYTAELADEYRSMAEAIAKKTGVDVDQISAAQASGQALLGQKRITQELTQGVVDFAAAHKISLDEAFKIVSKSVNSQVNMLQRYGISLDGATTSSEKLQRITEVLGQKYGGFAETQANAAGSTIKLHQAFDEMQKAIGEHLAPAFDLLVGGLTSVFKFFSQHSVIADTTADLILAAAAVAGIATVAGGASLALLGLRTAFLAAGISAEALTLSVRVLIGATGIGLLVIIASEIYAHWSTIFPRLQQIWKAFVDFFFAQGAALSTFFDGLIHFDPAKMKKGVEDWAAALKNEIKVATADIAKAPSALDNQTQNPVKKRLADADQKIQDEADRLALAKHKAQIELLHLENEHASKDTIELKKQEIQLLSELEQNKNQAIHGALLERLEEVRKLEREQAQIQKEQDAELKEELYQHNEAFQQMSVEQQEEFLAKNKAQLEQGLITKKTQLEAAAKVEADIQKKANNQYLLDQQKFGTAYATINKSMHSQVFEGSKSAFGELEGLTQSHQTTLKEIGRVAAIANIIIQTSQAAMNIYAGFSQIPIIGPALGVAGAAAAIAFGAERLGEVKGAAQGGLMEGGIPGKDSIPVLAQQGELVAPAQNFEEVIGSVRAAREAKQFGSSDAGSPNGQMLDVLKEIDQKLSAPMQQVIHVQGDVLGDPVWVDRLAKALSYAIEFRNLKIVGLNQA